MSGVYRLVIVFMAGIFSSACLTPEEPTAVEQGAVIYVKYCGFCHGDTGQGYVSPAANALSNQQFLASVDDTFLRMAIEMGRPGTKMSLWGTEYGGPLASEEVNHLIALMRSWQTEPSDTFSDTPVNGDIGAGQVAYDGMCATCHGVAGAGTDLALSLNNPVFLGSVSDAFLVHVINTGRAGTTMSAYADILTNTQINDIVALIRSWQTPIDLKPYQPVDPGEVILNPDGPEPGFDAGAEFIPCDTVKAAYDLGAKMVIVDARPGSDFAFEHIAGAVNIPFFEIESRLDEIPDDVWVITYCGCPHDESGIVAKAIRDKGHPKVAVLDEGYFDWKMKGYPVVVEGEEQGE
jgi:cytochrome c oxidase cbb3-type subunit 3